MTVLNNLSHVTANVDAFDKTAKITSKVIELYSVISGVADAGLKAFVFQLKEACALIEATRFVGAIKGLIIPNKNRVYFLNDPKNSWQTCAQRVTLAAGSLLKTIKSAAKFGFLQLGQIGKYSIGHLSLFNMAGDSFIVASNVFSAWESFNKVAVLEQKTELANRKIAKWVERPAEAALVRIGDAQEIAKLEEKSTLRLQKIKSEITTLELKARLCKDMLDKINPESPAFDATLNEKTRKEIADKYVKEASETDAKLANCTRLQTKHAGRISKIAARNFNALADELLVPNQALKIRHWEALRDSSQANAERKSAWLKIAASVSKVVVITFALTLVAINFWAPVATIPLLALGLFSDSIGLYKIFYEQSLAAKKVAA